jgi:hypothetical protein
MCFTAELAFADAEAKGAEIESTALSGPRFVSGAAGSQIFFFYVHENRTLIP